MKKERKLIKGLPYANDIVDLAVRLKLSPYEQLLLHNLRATMNGKNKACWLKQSTLAKRMGVSCWSVNKALDRLKSLGVLEISNNRKAGKFDNNFYEFNFPWNESPCVSHTHGSRSPYVSHRDGDTHTGDTRMGETDTNISKGTNRTKSECLINRSFNQDDGLKDSKNSKIKKEIRQENLNSDLRESENLKAEISADSFLDFERHGAAPPAASEKDLLKFYGRKVPKAIDLTTHPSNGKVNLSEFTQPFRRAENLQALHGKDFNGPLDEIFEKQIDGFYTDVIRMFWKHGKPGGGFKRSFKRAARAGVFHRCGLVFQTPQQLKEEQRKAKAREKAKREQALKQRAERELREANRERERQEALEAYKSFCDAKQRDIDEDYEFTPAGFKKPFPDFLRDRVSVL